MSSATIGEALVGLAALLIVVVVVVVLGFFPWVALVTGIVNFETFIALALVWVYVVGWL